jgi:hypothetical protein
LRHVVHRGEDWQEGSVTGTAEKQRFSTPPAVLIRRIAGHLFDAYQARFADYTTSFP